MEEIDWEKRSGTGFLASGIDPADQTGHKNKYIDILHKMALGQVLSLNGKESVLDFGCGSGRISHWIAPQVKNVVGLELTVGMIHQAENNRTSDNVQFAAYDGTHFPALPPFDLIISVWVLQYKIGESLKRTVLNLTDLLIRGGRFCLIEQVSDNPGIRRPAVQDYLDAFDKAGLDCLQAYPIRKGRWWLLYLIRYGFIPEGWFPRIARAEMKRRGRQSRSISYYMDYLFVTQKR